MFLYGARCGGQFCHTVSQISYRQRQFSYTVSMPQIYPQRTRRNRRSLVWIWRAIGIAIALFVVLNAVLYVYYRNRTYPNTYVMNTKIGNRTQSGVAAVIDQPNVTLLPEQVTLKHHDRSKTVPLAELGIREDTSKIGTISNSGHWFPLGQMFRKHTLPAPVAVDVDKLAVSAETWKADFYKAPVDASLSLNDANFSVTNGQDGFTLNTARLQNQLVAALRAGNTTVDAPMQQLKPAVTTESVQGTAQNLNKQLKTTLTYRFGGTTRTPDAKTIASWYAKQGNTYAVSDVALGNYLLQQAKQLNTSAGNVRDVMARTKTTLQNQTPGEFIVTPYAAAKTIPYCVAVKGVNESALPTLRSKLAHTYSDIRGWSLDGRINYKEVSSGCEFTVWLSAAYLMPTFGAICDSMWSCRVGPSVVINYDRWQNASPAWNKNGGTLDEYRDMVINHETGHWIGFGHASCGGRGQAAPVMQQQSIDLQGCTFSPWPSASEVNTARGKLGV